jgi:hypothetical protein
VPSIACPMLNLGLSKYGVQYGVTS